MIPLTWPGQRLLTIHRECTTAAVLPINWTPNPHARAKKKHIKRHTSIPTILSATHSHQVYSCHGNASLVLWYMLMMFNTQYMCLFGCMMAYLWNCLSQATHHQNFNHINAENQCSFAFFKYFTERHQGINSLNEISVTICNFYNKKR